jgi:ABC-type antimicrobial peptide transport system permease subunit
MGGLTFLIMLSLGLGFNYSLTSWRASAGLYYMFSFFLFIAGGLVLTIGLVSLSGISSTLTGHRVRDIGVMKAIGLAEEVNSFFLFESLILTLAGCALGFFSGFAGYMSLTAILGEFGFSLTIVQPGLILPILFLVVLFVTFASIYFPLYRYLMKFKVVEAMAPLTEKLSLGPLAKTRFFSRFNTFSKMALRSALGEKGSGRTLITIILVSTLLSTLVFGGQVISATAGRYVEEGVGRGTFLIAHRDIGSFYADRLSFNPGTNSNPPNFSDKSYTMSNSFLEWLRNQSYIEGVDPRFLTELEVREVQLVKPVPDGYETIGDKREASVLAMGVNPSDILNDWALDGRLLNQTDPMSLIMGDSMLEVVYDYTQEHLSVLGTSFDMVGVCIDPLNKGYTIYLNYGDLRSLTDFQGYNMILVQLNLTEVSLTEFTGIVENQGLKLYDLGTVLNSDLQFLQNMWFSISSLPSLTLLVGGLVLTNYTTISVTGRINDFKIMRAVGARKWDIGRVVLIEASVLILLGAIPGTIIGWVFTSNFLVLNPLLPSGLVLLFDLVFLLAIYVSMAVVSACYVRGIVEKAL